MLLNSIFSSILTTDTSDISIQSFMFCILVSIVLGIFIAYMYTIKTKYTQSFVLTLATLPAIVCMVILMVNGNIGAGVAVAGTFSLVRFRSVPGTAKEIGAIFLAMGAGLTTGMGYLGLATIFVVVISVVTLLLIMVDFGDAKKSEKVLTITIPEDLDYTGVFDDIFEDYTNFHEIRRVKTTNMGSMFKITYDIELKNSSREKEFIDELRCRNGNLEIMISKQVPMGTEL